jgi:hypothetical protein
MAVTFQHKIALRPGSVFCFGTISFVADEEGTLHRIADLQERKPSSIISGKAEAKQEIAQPPALLAKTTTCKPGEEYSFTRRTPLSTSSTEEWTRITRKKETRTHQAALLVPPPSKENRKKLVITTTLFYPDVLFIRGRVESSPISDDEPTVPGEEPPQREARRRRNQHCNARRHHEAGERDPAQPVSRDEISEVGETLDERVFKERRNSRRRDHQKAQEQAEQEARQRRENPLFGRNLNPDIARAMNTPSEVGGVLARIADGLPRTPDAEGYRWLLTRAANHLLPLTHPLSDLRHAINSRANNDMRTRFGDKKSMIGIMASLHEVRPPGLSRQQLQLAARPGDGRGSTSTTPLPRTDTTIVDRRIRVEYRRLLHISRLFSGPLTSRSPTSTSTSPSRTREASWLSTPLLPGPLGQLKM